MGKTKPTTVRADEKKLALVIEKEGVTSLQKAIDFLFDKYWWESKISGNPVMDAYMNQPHKIQHKPPTLMQANIDPFNAYLMELQSATSVGEIETTMKEVEKDTKLTNRDKVNIRVAAQEISKELNF